MTPSQKSIHLIPLSDFPVQLHSMISVFDEDGDGIINPAELMHAAKLYADSKTENKKLSKYLFFGGIGALVLMAVVFGLVAGVICECFF